jgi:hypothetical protein
MSSGQLHRRVAKMVAFFRNLGRKLPLLPSSQIIDREYIEGETDEEIKEIGEMTNIPDKAERHPTHFRKKKKVG